MFVLITCAVIFILALIVSFFVASVQKSGESGERDFDERQTLARNEAYKYGFNVGMVVNLLAFLVYQSGILPHVSADYFILAPVFAGVLVFAIIAIRKDAYLGFRQNKVKWAISMTLLAALNTFNGFFSSSNDSRVVPLERVAAVLFFMIVIYMALNQIFQPGDGEE